MYVQIQLYIYMRHSFKYFLWIGFLWLLACQSNTADSQSSANTPESENLPRQSLSLDLREKIDKLFSEVSQEVSPGYAISVLKNGQVLYQKGYGMANLDYEIPIQPNTVFSIASVSKQFTGACLALLILDKKISLEDPASRWIPELAKYSETIQIKHLIYNTSGLTDYYRFERPSGRSWHTFHYFEVDECLQTALASDTLAFKPGTRWDYSNVNFMLIAKIVEKISGQSFATFAQERLFKPLGMNHTFFNDDVTQIVKNRATPYNFRTSEAVGTYREAGVNIQSEGAFIRHPRISPHYGGSGIMTTVEDLSTWCANFQNKKFGGQAFYDLMHQTMKFEHDRDNQAFGIYFGDHNGITKIAWDGGDWGISADMARFPDSQVAVICLANFGSAQSFQKVNEITDILIDGDIFK